MTSLRGMLPLHVIATKTHVFAPDLKNQFKHARPGPTINNKTSQTNLILKKQS